MANSESNSQSVVLTSSERAKINAQRLAPRPTYYSASANKKLEISSELEAFLILSGKSALKSAAEWLTKTIELADIVKNRSGLIIEFLNNERDDVKATKEEIDEDLEDFTTFRDEFQAGKFGKVSEVSMMITDIQSMADEVFILQERLAHLNNLYPFIEDRLNHAGLTSKQLEQTKSWLGPLLAY